MRRKVLLSVFVVGLLAIANVAGAVTATTDMTTLSANDVAQTLAGPGITISNATFNGDPTQGGTFLASPGTIGFDTGVVLSSGKIADTIGPNTFDGTTTDFGGAGDADLTSLSGFDTFDAAVLEIEFTPEANTVFFRYVFSSEEYNEFVNSDFNDTFAFFINGVNCAVVDDGSGGFVPVTINTINGGGPFGTDPTNPALYRNNDLNNGGGSIATEMDGLTVVLTCTAPVNKNVTNTMKLAIADAFDGEYDSAVFLEEGSLSTTPPTTPPGDLGKVTGGGRVDLDDGAVTFGTVVMGDEQGLQGSFQMNDHRTGDRFDGYSVDSLSIVDDVATWSGSGKWNGEDGYRFEVTVTDNRIGNSDRKGDPDRIEATITDDGGAVVWSTGGSWDLRRGNVKIH